MGGSGARLDAPHAGVAPVAALERRVDHITGSGENPHHPMIGSGTPDAIQA